MSFTELMNVLRNNRDSPTECAHKLLRITSNSTVDEIHVALQTALTAGITDIDSLTTVLIYLESTEQKSSVISDIPEELSDHFKELLLEVQELEKRVKELNRPITETCDLQERFRQAEERSELLAQAIHSKEEEIRKISELIDKKDSLLKKIEVI